MTAEARFSDGAPEAAQALRLRALSVADLVVLSTLMQDAVLKPADLRWLPRQRRFVVIAHRFRWEEQRGRERVQTGLHVSNVLRAQVRGIDRQSPTPLALLAMAFAPKGDGPEGELRFSFAGGGDIALHVEALEVDLRDMTQPWAATATPKHPK